MTAIAEEATLRLRIAVERTLQGAGPEPIDRLHALGHGFLEWALGHPTAFRLVSARRLYRFERSRALLTHFAAVRDLTVQLVEAAQAAGQLPQWGVSPRRARTEVTQALDLLVSGLTTKPRP